MLHFTYLLIRPTDILVGGLRFHRDSIFFLSSLRAGWTELSQNRPHARKWVRFENVCPKSGVFHPLQIGGPKPPSWRLRDLTATLTAYIFGVKHHVYDRASALQPTRGLVHRLKTTWTLVHKRLKIESAFLLILCKFCILFHCQASQTDISKRNSTKLCQTVDGKSR